MAKTKTKEELQANIEKARIEIRQGENYVKQLLKKNHQQERKQRSHRLIERGAIAESLIAGADALNNLCSVPLQNAPSMLTAAQRVADANNLRARTRKYKLNNLQKYAETCCFLTKYHINDGEQLYNGVKKISDRHVAVANAIKDKTRRLETLEKHLFMNECLKLNKGVYRKYTRLDQKKRDGYKAKHTEEIRLYEEAHDYFKAVMNGRKDPLPIKNWKKEWETLTVEKYGLVAEYYELADEIKAAETVIRGLKMMEKDEPQRSASRTQGVEL